MKMEETYSDREPCTCRLDETGDLEWGTCGEAMFQAYDNHNMSHFARHIERATKRLLQGPQIVDPAT